jgi:general secretion pathway protein A
VLEQLDMKLFTSLVLNPFLSGEELLREILLDFGVVSREAVRSGRIIAARRHELIATLHEFLTSLVPIGASGVLIIDEAQHLSPQVLEEIRVLSNLETNRSKLLQIVLVGQLTLIDRLKQPQSKQLDQRVSLRAVLTPLGRTDLEAYVIHRLSVAGETGQVAFEDRALDVVLRASGGVPRVINLICDRGLMIGAQSGARVITTQMIDASVVSLGLQRPSLPRRWWREIQLGRLASLLDSRRWTSRVSS